MWSSSAASCQNEFLAGCPALGSCQHQLNRTRLPARKRVLGTCFPLPQNRTVQTITNVHRLQSPLFSFFTRERSSSCHIISSPISFPFSKPAPPTSSNYVGSTIGSGVHPEEGRPSLPYSPRPSPLIPPFQVVDAIKDLVQDCNFDCNDSGIALQAMDNSHVALVSMLLMAESFSPYRCDRNIALGVNLTSLTKVLRAAQNEDILTLKAEDAPDSLNLVFESSENDRISEYDLKLMDIDQEHLGIPETEYASTIVMPSAEFKRICTDLMAMSESGELNHRLGPGFRWRAGY